MKFTIALMLATLMCTETFAQLESDKQIYRSPKLEEEKKRIKSVAVLPFTVNLSFKKLPKGMTAEMIKEEEKQGREELQHGLYTYLLKKQENFTVTIQDPQKTNIILKKAKQYEADSLELILPDSLARLLGVDAVIRSNWTYTKTTSDGVALAKFAISGFGGSTGSGALTLQIYNSTDGELLWRFYKEMNEQFTAGADDTIERMMKKLGRNFPLEK